MCYLKIDMKRAITFSLALLIIFLGGCSRDHPPIDWNDAALDWHSFDEGMEEIKATGSKGILIIYADWCPTCKQYSGLFRHRSVINALRGITLIRVNQDKQPAISRKYNIDGEYVPRTFALGEDGKIIRDLNSSNPKWWYFLSAKNPDSIIRFAELLHEY